MFVSLPHDRGARLELPISCCRGGVQRLTEHCLYCMAAVYYDAIRSQLDRVGIGRITLMGLTQSTDTPSPGEIEDRRKQVLAFHLMRMTQAEIAVVVDCDRTTVRRDLKWIQEHWDDELGHTSHIDPDSMLGKMVAVFAEPEQRALADLKRWSEESAGRRGEGDAPSSDGS